MVQVMTICEVMLRPGVSALDFEQFVRGEFCSSPEFPGAESFILKGDRGDRTGSYLHLRLWEEIATRNRYFPGDGTLPLAEQDAARRREYTQWLQKLFSLVQMGIDTSYVLLGKEMRTMTEEVLIEGVLLRPGVSEADFERFAIEEYYLMTRLPGEEGFLLKGDRGDREGGYLLLIAYENLEIRQRRSSGKKGQTVQHGWVSEEMRKWLDSDSVQLTVKKWNSLAQTGLYTSYVVLVN